MGFLAWLDQTPFAQFIASDTYTFPILLCMHAVGMGAVVGIVWIMSLRVLGYPQGLALDTFRRLARVAYAGFALNAGSGILIFIAEATRIIVNRDFQIKMGCILAGGICVWYLSRAVSQAENAGQLTFPVSAKVLAVVTSLFWLVAILAGRYIGYTLKPPY